MPRYRITNRITGDCYEVEAPFAADACKVLGWQIGDCHVKQLRSGPYTWLYPPLRCPSEDEDKLREE